MVKGKMIVEQPKKEEKEVTINGIPKSEYYLIKNLGKDSLQSIDTILAGDISEEKVTEVKNILRVHAEMRGRNIPDITLHDPQVDPVLMSEYNPRIFIGDKPGLGKTVMSAGTYANYVVNELRAGREPKKVIVVTVSSHVVGFAKEWKAFGINLIPLTKGTQGIRRAFRNNNIDEFDGVIINWDSLRTNGFLEHYLEHHEKYDFGVFDETSRLLNPKTSTYKSTNAVVNEFKGGLTHVVFLNGSSFEKDLFDFYYQFGILQPKLIPTKSFLEERYIVRGGRNIFYRDHMRGRSRQQIEYIRRKTGEIEDYKNQEELRDRLKYYYIARSKQDYADNLPEHSYNLHTVEPTPAQYKALDEQFLISVVNSPATGDPDKKLTRSNSPKLDQLINFADEVSDDRPIIYVYNREAQKTIQEELEKEGYKVGVLNGGSGGAEDRSAIVDAFNNYEYDMLVFNIINAINLPTSERILFYDIPMMPQTTNQIKGRIDRNNYDTKKFYDFFCYLDSPEMINIIKLACFREYHSNKFTGQYENIYGMLVSQLSRQIGIDKMMEAEEKIDNMYESNETFEEVTDEIRGVLGI